MTPEEKRAIQTEVRELIEEFDALSRDLSDENTALLEAIKLKGSAIEARAKQKGETRESIPLLQTLWGLIDNKLAEDRILNEYEQKLEGLQLAGEKNPIFQWLGFFKASADLYSRTKAFIERNPNHEAALDLHETNEQLYQKAKDKLKKQADGVKLRLELFEGSAEAADRVLEGIFSKKYSDGASKGFDAALEKMTEKVSQLRQEIEKKAWGLKEAETLVGMNIGGFEEKIKEKKHDEALSMLQNMIVPESILADRDAKKYNEAVLKEKLTLLSRLEASWRESGGFLSDQERLVNLEKERVKQDAKIVKDEEFQRALFGDENHPENHTRTLELINKYDVSDVDLLDPEKADHNRSILDEKKNIIESMQITRRGFMFFPLEGEDVDEVDKQLKKELAETDKNLLQVVELQKTQCYTEIGALERMSFSPEILSLPEKIHSNRACLLNILERAKSLGKILDDLGAPDEENLKQQSKLNLVVESAKKGMKTLQAVQMNQFHEMLEKELSSEPTGEETEAVLKQLASQLERLEMLQQKIERFRSVDAEEVDEKEKIEVLQEKAQLKTEDLKDEVMRVELTQANKYKNEFERLQGALGESSMESLDVASLQAKHQELIALEEKSLFSQKEEGRRLTSLIDDLKYAVNKKISEKRKASSLASHKETLQALKENLGPNPVLKALQEHLHTLESLVDKNRKGMRYTEVEESLAVEMSSTLASIQENKKELVVKAVSKENYQDAYTLIKGMNPPLVEGEEGFHELEDYKSFDEKNVMLSKKIGLLETLKKNLKQKKTNPALLKKVESEANAANALKERLEEISACINAALKNEELTNEACVNSQQCHDSYSAAIAFGEKHPGNPKTLSFQRDTKTILGKAKKILEERFSRLEDSVKSLEKLGVIGAGRTLLWEKEVGLLDSLNKAKKTLWHAHDVKPSEWLPGFDVPDEFREIVGNAQAMADNMTVRPVPGKSDKILAEGNFGITQISTIDLFNGGAPVQRMKVVEKILKTPNGEPMSPKQLAGLRKEAAMTSFISHPNIPKSYGMNPEGTRFYQELIPSVHSSLSKELLAHEWDGTSLSLFQKIETTLNIVNALTCLADHNVTHGDVHPGNMVRSLVNNKCFLADYGEASLLTFNDDFDPTKGERRKATDRVLFEAGMIKNELVFPSMLKGELNISTEGDRFAIGLLMAKIFDPSLQDKLVRIPEVEGFNKINQLTKWSLQLKERLGIINSSEKIKAMEDAAPEMYALMKALLDMDGSRKISFKEILDPLKSAKRNEMEKMKLSMEEEFPGALFSIGTDSEGCDVLCLQHLKEQGEFPPLAIYNFDRGTFVFPMVETAFKISVPTYLGVPTAEMITAKIQRVKAKNNSKRFIPSPPEVPGEGLTATAPATAPEHTAPDEAAEHTAPDGEAEHTAPDGEAEDEAPDEEAEHTAPVLEYEVQVSAHTQPQAEYEAPPSVQAQAPDQYETPASAQVAELNNAGEPSLEALNQQLQDLEALRRANTEAVPPAPVTPGRNGSLSEEGSPATAPTPPSRKKRFGSASDERL